MYFLKTQCYCTLKKSQNGVNITFMGTEKPKNSCDSFYCTDLESNPQHHSVQLLSHARLFVTPWTAPHQASLSIPISQSLLKLMCIELVMPFNHLILCHSLLLPSIFLSIRVFSNESVFPSGGQSIGAGVPDSASVLPMNIQVYS